MIRSLLPEQQSGIRGRLERRAEQRVKHRIVIRKAARVCANMLSTQASECTDPELRAAAEKYAQAIYTALAETA